MHDEYNPERLTRRRFSQIAAAGYLGISTRRLGAASDTRSITGTVQGEGAPLPNVRVSDGMHVTATDSRGRFELKVDPHSGPFVFVTTPRDYWTDAFAVPTAQARRQGTVTFRLTRHSQRDRFRFVFWTDMHLEKGGHRLEKFSRSVAETMTLAPDFVWAQGDICLQGNAGADYRSHSRALTVPLRNGAGNHELMVSETNPRAAFHTLFGPTYYSFDWAGIHCVVLDGNHVVSAEKDWRSVRGALSARELAWLKADLQATPPGMPVIAGIHIPLRTTYSARRSDLAGENPAWIVANRDQVHELLKAHGGKLVLQGHLHENERILHDGIEYVTCQAMSGMWWQKGTGFERGVDNAPRGYRVVDVDGATITHRFHSSCESHVNSDGELLYPDRLRVARRRSYFVFNMYDAPNGARARGCIDGGPLQELTPHTVLHHGLRMIMPHHYLLATDTTRLRPGPHDVKVEVVTPTGTLDHRTSVSIIRRERVPLIYSSDLYHPHQDPDDHFDLAAIFAIPEIDLRAIILDDGARQKRHPGRIPVEQMMEITGRTVPVATGLAPHLTSPRDTGATQPADYQGGVRLILTTLRESPEPVTIVAVGSLRDVAAAYNRDPRLCAEKIERLYVFIGDAHSAPGFPFREYNATLDPQAYMAVMHSGLPVYWVPCFDGGAWKNRGRASFWRAGHQDLIGQVRDPLKQYFIYGLHRRTEPHRPFLSQPVDAAAWLDVCHRTRNLWCCAVFTHIVDRTIVHSDGAWHSIPRGKSLDGASEAPFFFERVQIAIDPTGMTLYPTALPWHAVERFTVRDPETYPAAMTALTAELLKQL